MLHTLSSPDIVDQTRMLPRSFHTLWNHSQGTNQSGHDEPGGIIADVLHVASGEIEATFLHFDIEQVVRELLQSVNHTEEGAMQFKHQKRRMVSTGERLFDELHNGNCWQDLE